MSTISCPIRSIFSRKSFALAIVVIAILVAGCGGSDKVVADGALAKDKGVPTIPVPTTLPSVAGKPCKQVTDLPKGKSEGKPTAILMPDGVPPKELQKFDLKEGTGPEAKEGDPITVNYVGIACSTGKQFDSSWDRGDTFSTTLSKDGIIDGWVKGVPGMRVGGQRQLVIPPDLAYGDQGQNGINPGETLVFVIDLISVAPPPTPGSTTVPAAAAPTTAGSATTTTNG